MIYHVASSRLAGTCSVPPSKSHTMRALLLAAMAAGQSRVRKPLPSPDTEAMITACRALGATVEQDDAACLITGVAGSPRVPEQIIDVGNSGQVLRFGAALAALLPQYSIFTGDASVRSIRPMQPLLDGLSQLGALAVSSKNDGHAPVIIRGPAHSGEVCLDGADSQPVSALLFLAAFLSGTTRIKVNEPGELPWIDLTLHWLDKIGARHTNENYRLYTVEGPVAYSGFDYTVPGDWSSAAFPLAAALVTKSSITLDGMDLDDAQGDKAILGILERMGARLEIKKDKLTVLPHDGLHGVNVDVNAVIDAVPVLAAVACFAQGPTTITGAAIARRKESDRLAGIAQELIKMGARIEEFEDGLTIHPMPLHGARVNSRHDHRLAMALAVAGLATGDTAIEDTACVSKSFPGFAAIMGGIGANIREEGR